MNKLYNASCTSRPSYNNAESLESYEGYAVPLKTMSTSVLSIKKAQYGTIKFTEDFHN